MNRLDTKNVRGFTIVEIVIVVAVISILASIVIIAGSSYINRTNETSLKAKLSTAAGAMKNEYNKEGFYPGSIPSSVDTTGITLSGSSNSTTFCISGINGSTTYRVTHSDMTPSANTC